MLDVEKMKVAIERQNWGNKVAAGDHFYRLIFKLEKKGQSEALKQEEIFQMFQSYKDWEQKTGILVEECRKNDTRDDRKAVEYWEKMQQDLLEHMHQIISTSDCDNTLIIDEIIAIADRMD